MKAVVLGGNASLKKKMNRIMRYERLSMTLTKNVDMVDGIRRIAALDGRPMKLFSFLSELSASRLSDVERNRPRGACGFSPLLGSARRQTSDPHPGSALNPALWQTQDAATKTGCWGEETWREDPADPGWRGPPMGVQHFLPARTIEWLRQGLRRVSLAPGMARTCRLRCLPV